MHFRCPNCHQPIMVEDQTVFIDDQTQNTVTCPSCNSAINLAQDHGAAIIRSPGFRVEHFELQEVLGEGSFGTVYKAWDTQLQRTVAIKLPRPGAMNAATSRLFLREAQIAAGVTHSNVVSVYEVGKSGESFYIASQFIDGVSLRELLSTRQLTERQSIEMVIQLLRGIQVFHEQGIIHRDLKPGNILVDKQSKPYVADFGLARQEQGLELTVTQSGKVIGTVLYMSPEQARGENKSLTSRTDIYGMGVVMYELLTGHRPFEVGGSRTVLYRILTEDVPTPRKDKRRLPRDLETICLMALRKDPERRYESAGAMADDLQHYLDGKPIQARPVSVMEKAWMAVRRNRMISAAVFVAMTAITVAGMATVRPTLGTVPVFINTENGAASLHFIRYDSTLKVPHASGFEAQGASGALVDLMPGMYLISGRDKDDRHHEIWRTVPEMPTTATGDFRFPHRAWKIEKGIVHLQPFRLFDDADVTEPVAMVRGGEFEAGNENVLGEMAVRHPQQVSSLKVGVNEVSYQSFRLVMNQPLKGGNVQSTYLQQFNQQYGDRSEIAETMPVTGYPVDVAIVYCELAGGRLPNCIEWEFVATLGGTANYSTGTEPPVGNAQEIAMLPVNAATRDTTPSGIRNLCSSVAEYTQSQCVNYAMLYPSAFQTPPELATSREDLQRLPDLTEVRGASEEWIRSGTASALMNPRQRIVAPFPPADSAAKDVYARIGWRLVRSAE